MITSFDDFLFESVKDVKIYYSIAFAERLASIYNNTQYVEVKNLVRSLLNIQDTTRYMSDSSFIDITDKNDKISFIPVSRLQRMYDEKKLSIENLGGKYQVDFEQWIWQNSQDRQVGGLSEPFLRFRQEVGLGRFVSKIFREVIKSEISDSTLEKFINHYKSLHDFEKDASSRIQLVSGEDIRKWYLADNYSEIKGQLGSSCMRYESCQKYLDIYVENPEVCQLLILWANEQKTKISARALVWKLTNGKTVMDRIYSVADYEQNLFKDWAKQQGWTHVSQLTGQNTIQLQKSTFDYYPYMDNFCYLNIDSKILTNSGSLSDSGWFQLQNTDGSYSSDDNTVWSEYHGEYLDRDNAVYCDDVDSYVHVDDAIYLEYCDKWVSPNADVSYSNYHGESYYTDDTVYSEVLQDSLYNQSAEEIRINQEGDTDWIPDDLSLDQFVQVEIDGEEVRTLKKFTIFDPIEKKYHFLDEVIDGVSILKVIENKLEGVEVVRKKILEAIINSPITEKSLKQKFTKLQNLYNRYCGHYTDLDKLLKLFIFLYPKEFISKRTLQIKRYSWDEAKKLKRKLKDEANPKLLRKLGFSEKYEEVLDRFSESNIYNMFYLSYFFIEDIIQEQEALEMWYKDKLS